MPDFKIGDRVIEKPLGRPVPDPRVGTVTAVDGAFHKKRGVMVRWDSESNPVECLKGLMRPAPETSAHAQQSNSVTTSASTLKSKMDEMAKILNKMLRVAWMAEPDAFEELASAVSAVLDAAQQDAKASEVLNRIEHDPELNFVVLAKALHIEIMADGT